LKRRKRGLGGGKSEKWVTHSRDKNLVWFVIFHP
jgi:hypothetical protein